MAAWTQLLRLAARGHISALCLRISLQTQPTCFLRDFQHPVRLSSCVPPSFHPQVRELLTRFPSATPFSLALGADLPWEDYLYPGNLGFTANRFFTCFIVTHVSIITSLPSTAPCDATSARWERSPTTGTRPIRSFGIMLSPVTFSAQRH